MTSEPIEKLVEELAAWLVEMQDVIPVGPLAVFLHTAYGLAASVTQPRDLEEARNYRLFLELRGGLDPKLAGPVIAGSFKPPEFVHPFESHYSTPGYLDTIVLPRFFAATDSLAAEEGIKANGRGFLAFVYVTFLLIHPFVDGNGRVARAILDYYNKRLKLELSGSWNNRPPKHPMKFSDEPAHKAAFQAFFRNNGLKPLCCLSLHPISDELRPEFGKMADNLLYEIARAATECTFEAWEPVRRLASIIT